MATRKNELTGMDKLVNEIFAVSKDKDIPVTNLQLQKTMYFVIKDFYNSNKNNENNERFIKNVYDVPFETWQYGPVVPEIYREFENNGSLPIIKDGKHYKEYRKLDKLILKYICTFVFKLVRKTHEEPVWKNYASEIKMGVHDHRYSFHEVVTGRED